MKLRFFLLTFLLLVARGCDFYSTSLWFFKRPTDETNPLTSVLGFGWNGLVLVNIALVGLIIYAFYVYSYKYFVQKVFMEGGGLTDYISEGYFNKKGQFYRVFYQAPKNKQVLIAHLGYIMVRVLIVGSFLATGHNLCQYYDVVIYNSLREVVIRPLFVIYGLVALTFIFFVYRLWNREFMLNKNLS